MADPILMSLRGVRNGPQTVGDMLRFGVLMRGTAGSPVDPTTVKFLYLAPSDNTPTTLTYGSGGASAALVKNATGDYSVDLTLDEEGSWAIRWEAAGNYIGATEFLVTVAPSSF